MCGLAGCLELPGSLPEAELTRRVSRMADSLTHRGPDDSGAWADAETGIALGHRRLSIVDLSPSGSQPMRSHDGRYIIAFNGEIYNHTELRVVVESVAPETRWRGHSDTEVFLCAIECWGVRGALKRSVGMFAFALWDRSQRKLHLVRDRLGEKPLYYGWMGRTLVFGSELKALRRHPGWGAEIDRDALALYLRHGYVPAPRSIYVGIQKLLPGSIATLSLGEAHREPGKALDIELFWSPKTEAEHGAGERFRGSAEEAVDRLEGLLRAAVRNQMIADVPVGAFLSGGIDSSIIVALMQKESRQPVRTFTIGFHERAYDEAAHARAVAKHLGTDHDELYVTAREALQVVPSLPEIYDEPFADPSQIPTFLVARQARRQVTVCLSGDGGDELFGGYTRYRQGMRIWRWLKPIPPLLRAGLASFTSSMLVPAAEGVQRGARLLRLHRLMDPRASDKLSKISDILGVDQPKAFYRSLLTHWRFPARTVSGSVEPYSILNHPDDWPALDGIAEQMMYLDTITYLPDDILVKVDRAGMACSLESRIPMLDHRVVEFAWSLPRQMKIAEDGGKWLLRQVLYRHVPRSLVDRPKMGFGVPVAEWLRGPLRAWAEALLDRRLLEEEGFFCVPEIRTKWLEHVSGRKDWQFLLWDVLMFQAWLQAQRAPLGQSSAAHAVSSS
jgi:asparagine synthase (glutamine-hydrolysing)